LEKRYTILHVEDRNARGHSLLMDGREGWGSQLQKLPEITATNVMFDLQDVQKFQVNCFGERLKVLQATAGKMCNWGRQRSQAQKKHGQHHYLASFDLGLSDIDIVFFC